MNKKPKCVSFKVQIAQQDGMTLAIMKEAIQNIIADGFDLNSVDEVKVTQLHGCMDLRKIK